ncbi:hypothetical protein Cadr_000007427 [Camelus dromedarius]|uniref:Uncharacterized protein n=1 Tax=Camelus dromedarius TaxID=9838 RepID=A0A5N4E626_CAMDR|nr:hypothetical protein Cadr_000007427 [Camelus dromedarius]
MVEIHWVKCYWNFHLICKKRKVAIGSVGLDLSHRELIRRGQCKRDENAQRQRSEETSKHSQLNPEREKKGRTAGEGSRVQEEDHTMRDRREENKVSLKTED